MASQNCEKLIQNYAEYGSEYDIQIKEEKILMNKQAAHTRKYYKF